MFGAEPETRSRGRDAEPREKTRARERAAGAAGGAVIGDHVT